MGRGMDISPFKTALDLASKCYWFAVTIVVILVILVIVELTLDLAKHR